MLIGDKDGPWGASVRYLSRKAAQIDELTGPGVEGGEGRGDFPHTRIFQMTITFANGGQLPIPDRILTPHIKGFRAIVLLG
jgi:hypothetical protein